MSQRDETKPNCVSHQNLQITEPKSIRKLIICIFKKNFSFLVCCLFILTSLTVHMTNSDQVSWVRHLCGLEVMMGPTRRAKVRGPKPTLLAALILPAIYIWFPTFSSFCDKIPFKKRKKTLISLVS